MLNYTPRLDKALRVASWAHAKAKQLRKGTDIPYIIHPFGTFIVASSVTDDENTLIACLLHDVLEDVSPSVYRKGDLVNDFGAEVANIVQDVTKDQTISDWHTVSKAYLDHLQTKAKKEAVIVCGADKIHNLTSTLIDYQEVGDTIWQRFTTKNIDDQIWWYESVLAVLQKRQAPQALIDQLSSLLNQLKECK